MGGGDEIISEHDPVNGNMPSAVKDLVTPTIKSVQEGDYVLESNPSEIFEDTKNDLFVLSALEKEDAEPSYRNEDETLPFDESSNLKTNKCMKEKLQYCETDLMTGIWSNDVELVRTILETTDISTTRKKLNNMAAGLGRVEVLKLLLQYLGKEAVLAVDGQGIGPLFRAAEFGELAALKYLVDELGADVNQQDQQGRTPIFSAIKFYNPEDKVPYTSAARTVEFLLERGANPAHTDMYGNDVLCLATRATAVPVVRLLVERASSKFSAEALSKSSELTGNQDVYDIINKAMDPGFKQMG